MNLKTQPGQKYGKWTAITYLGHERWLCKCDCGTERSVASGSLQNGRSKSCGCVVSPKDDLYNEMKKKKILERITIKENECWEWNLYKNERGYGTTTYRRKPGQRVNRICWVLWKGEIKEGLYVLHKCDNPSCCNPEHLFLGTHEDNMKDMALKGRACQGNDHHKVKKMGRKICQTNS
jgi:hypothetical protein